MKQLITCLTLLLGVLTTAYGQGAYHQPCLGQDTSTLHQVNFHGAYSIARSNNDRVAVTGHNWAAKGAKARVKIWRRFGSFAQGFRADDSLYLVAPKAVAFDSSGNMYIVQAERRDSNILIYDTSYHLIRVINNDSAAATTWSNPRGIALDAAQNLYLISGDSLRTDTITTPNTGKLIRISNPLSAATKSVLLDHLKDPKAVAISNNDVFVSEFTGNRISRYDLPTMTRVDSISLNKPMDLFTTGCTLYVSDSNTVKIFDAQNLAAGPSRTISRVGRNHGPLGLLRVDDLGIYVCDPDSNRVAFYPDSDIIHTSGGTYVSTGGPIVYLICNHSTMTLTDSFSLGTWSSGNPLVASIDATTGFLSALSAGETAITHILGVDTSRFWVEVQDSLTSPGTIFTYDAYGGLVFDSVELCITNSAVLYSTASIGWGWDYWSSSNGSVAIAHYYSGSVWPKGQGICTIYHHLENACNSVQSSYRVKVDSMPAIGIIVGETPLCVLATAIYRDSGGAAGGSWYSDDPSIATINDTGLVTMLSPVATTIEYSVANLTCTATNYLDIGVNSTPMTDSITGSDSVCEGRNDTLILHASGSISSHLWSSSNSSVATVNSAGIVHAIHAGTAIIKYVASSTCGSDSTTYTVVVRPRPDSGTISSSSSVLCSGSYSGYYHETVSGGTWSSTGSISIDIYGYAMATVTAEDTGSILYTVTTPSCGSAVARYPVTLLVTPHPFSVDGDSTLCTGAPAYYYNSEDGGNWSSTGPVDVSPYGVVTVTGPGSGIITYTIANACGFETASQHYSSIDPPSTGTITGTDSICTGASATLTDVGGSGTWSVTNSHLTISTLGVIYGVSGGRDTVLYSASNYCGSSTSSHIVYAVTTPSSATITGPSIICVGSPVTYTSTGGAGSGGYWAASGVTSVSSGGTATVSSVGTGTVSYIIATTLCGTATATHAASGLTVPNPGTISGLSNICVGGISTLTDTASSGTWAASNSHLTISTTGAIHGISAGIDTVTYTVVNACGSSTSSIVITVLPATTSGTISGLSVFCLGSTSTYTETVTGGTWSASGVVSISSAGVASASGTGTGVITYSVSDACGFASSTFPVSVITAASSGTIIGPDSVCLGSTTTLTDVGGSGTWGVTNSVLSISTSGVITALTAGIDTVTVFAINACGSNWSTHTIKVVPPLSMGTMGAPDSICVGSSTSVTSSYSTGYWGVVTGHLSVTSGGVITAVSPGYDTVTYTTTNICGSTVTRRPVVVSSPLSPGVISGPYLLCPGTTITLVDTTSGGSWSCSNADATVSGGVVTGVTAGGCSIFYTVGNICGTYYASWPLTIIHLPAAGTITGSITSLCVGQSGTLHDGTSGGVWLTSNAHATATGGVVTGVSAGTVVITFSVSNYCGTAYTTYGPILINPLPTAGVITGASLVCPGLSISLSDTATGGTWQVSNTLASISTGGVLTAAAPGTDTVSYSRTNVCGTATVYQVVNIIPYPVAGSITGDTAYCTGSSFVATDSISGGTWSLSNTHASLAGTIVTAVSAGIDTLTYAVTNYCGTAYARHRFHISTLVVPSVSIDLSPSDTICEGDTVRYSANYLNGGTSPAFEWRRFTTVVGTGTSYTYSPAFGDYISVKMTTNVVCPTIDTVVSSSVSVVVNPELTPSVVITALPNDTVAYLGQLITFYAEASYGGSAPTYQWYKNGNLVPGATSTTYSINIYSNDTVYCKVVSNVACATVTHVTSNTIIIYADYLGVHDVIASGELGSFSLYPNPNNGHFILAGTTGANTGTELNLEVRDVLGKLVFSCWAKADQGKVSKEINMENRLVPGYYILKIIGSAAETSLPFIIKE